MKYIYIIEKECKHSVRYKVNDENAVVPLRSVYVMRDWLMTVYGKVPKEIEVEVTIPNA